MQNYVFKNISLVNSISNQILRVWWMYCTVLSCQFWTVVYCTITVQCTSVQCTSVQCTSTVQCMKVHLSQGFRSGSGSSESWSIGWHWGTPAGSQVPRYTDSLAKVVKINSTRLDSLYLVPPIYVFLALKPLRKNPAMHPSTSLLLVN